MRRSNRSLLATAFALLPFLPLILASQLPLHPQSPPFLNDDPVPDPDPPHTQSLTIIDHLSLSPSHSILLHLLQRTRLVPTLNLLQGVTLMAVTDEGWEGWGEEKLRNGDGDGEGMGLVGGMEGERELARLVLSFKQGRQDSIATDQYNTESDLADNVLWYTRSLLLYHLLNYNLPAQPSSPSSLIKPHPNDTDRYLLPSPLNSSLTLSTESTFLFPHMHSPKSPHSPAEDRPPEWPWAPKGDEGALGGKGQKLRILYDYERNAFAVAGKGEGIWGGGKGKKGEDPEPGREQDDDDTYGNPLRVGVDSNGGGGVNVWTGWMDPGGDKPGDPPGNATDAGEGMMKVGKEKGKGKGKKDGTVKGRRVVKASNGLVIGLEGVLEMPEDIGTQVANNPDLSIFQSLLSYSDSSLLPSRSIKDLSSPSSPKRNLDTPHSFPNLTTHPHLTLLAPLNSAFDQFDELERRYLFSDVGGEGRERVRRSLVVMDVGRGRGGGLVGKGGEDEEEEGTVGWRSNFVKKNGEGLTLSNDTLQFSVNETGTLFINDTAITHPDLFASNGVIHLTSRLPLPHDFKLLNSPEKLFLSLNATRFVALLRETGLSEVYTSRQASRGVKRTFLVPTDEVLEEWQRWSMPSRYSAGEEETTFAADISAKLEETLRYHILPDRLTPQDLWDGALVETELNLTSAGMAGDSLKQRIRVQVDRNKHEDGMEGSGAWNDIHFGGATVIAEPVHRDDYIVYLISTLNEPPSDIVSTAVTDINLSTFIASLFAAKLDRLAIKTSGITWLAPTNVAFSKIGLVGKYLLSTDARDDLRKVLRYNAIEGVVYQQDVANGTTSYKTLLGDKIDVTKSWSSEFNTTDIYISGPTLSINRNLEINNQSVPVKGQIPGRISKPDMLTQTGAIQPVEGLQLPNNVNITIGKLLHAAQANTLIDLLVKAKMDWLLNGSLPPMGLKAKEGEEDGERRSILRLPYTILAPTDDAFSRINLTYYRNNEAALLSLLKLHTISASILPRGTISGRNFKTYLSYPLKLWDAVQYSTLQSSQSKYGDVVFRYDGHGSWLVGVNNARGSGQEENVARVLEAGQATPIWQRKLEKLAGKDWEDANIIPGGFHREWTWSTIMSLGGGVMMIDRVLMPYEPNWFADWGYLAVILGVGGVLLVAAGVFGVIRWKKGKRIKLEEEGYAYSTLEGEDVEDD